MGLKLRAAAACGLMGAAALCARADVVEMKDGRRFEGNLTADRPYDIVIDTMVNNIRVSMTLQRTEIKSITRSPLPAGFFDRPASKETPAAPAEIAPAHHAAESKAGAYIEVPLEGSFGRDIYPKGVEAALKLAVDHGIRHVVFRIHSPGGEVWAAKKIMEILDQYQGKVVTHALIEQAMSASIWVVFACDHIEIVPGGAVGAAVVFRGDASTGSAQVDEKMNSALAGELGAIAERHNHSPAVVRAMIIPEAELYAWNEGDRPRVSAERPDPSPPGLRVLSTDRDVLTLTADEAGQIGLATELKGHDAAEIGPDQGIDGWAATGNMGAAAMQRGCKQSAQVRADLDRAAERLRRAVTEAGQADPTRYSYQATESGVLSIESRRRWTELSDKALAAWTEAKRALSEFKAEQAKAAELGMEALVERVDPKDMKTTLAEIDSRITDLRRGRIRDRLPAEFQKK